MFARGRKGGRSVISELNATVRERVQVDLLIIAARTIHPQSNNFAASIKIKARVDSIVYDNP